MEEYHFNLTNNSAELEELQRQLQSVLQATGIRLSIISAINVALGEWLENIIQYAYADGGTHRISVDCRIGAAEIVLQITDDGRPFDPCSYPALELRPVSSQTAQTGRGIHLIRHLVERLEYRRQGTNNVVSLSKVLS